MFKIPYLLKRAATLFPNKGIEYKDAKRTYKEVYDRVLRAANSFNSLGIKKGTIIGVADWNTSQSFEMHYVAAILGAIMCPIPVNLPLEQIKYVIKLADIEYLCLSQNFTHLSDIIDDSRVIGLDFNAENTYDDMVKKGENIEPDINVGPDDIFSILFTSGTTGLPKAVRYTHEKVIHGALSIAHQLGLYDAPAKLSSNDKILPLIPIFHIWSWGVPIFGPYLGADIILGGRFNPAETASLIHNKKVTWINCVPTMMEMLLSQEDKFDGLKVLIGGSPITFGLAKKMENFGIKFSTIYGGSDMLATSISIITDDAKKGDIVDYLRLTTHPVPFVETKIVKVGNINTEAGELYLKEPWLPNEYYKNEEKTKESYIDGWFRTGDMAVILPDGGIRILDRVKDAIKSGGEWIPTSILESVISEINGVELVAVVGRQDEKWGERPIAFIVGSITEEEIKDYLNRLVEDGKIAKWWIPDEIKFLDEMPLTGTGKINKIKLREYLKNI